MNLLLNHSACLVGLNELDCLISTEINEEDGDEVAEHIAKLACMQGYSARLMASCVYLKRTEPKNPEYWALEVLADRLNSALGKNQMSFNSILSRLKVERQMSPFGS